MKRFEKILCVASPDETSEVGLARAVALAEENQAALTVVDVVDEIPPDTRLLERVLATEDLRAAWLSERRRRLGDWLASRVRDARMDVKVLSGIPFLEVIREVLRHGHDLVVKSVDDHGVVDRLFGSDDMHLLRKCPCPVWLVKPDAREPYRRILAAVDVGECSPSQTEESRDALNCRVLGLAASLAISEFAELHVVHAWEAMGEGMMESGVIAVPEEEIAAYVDEVKTQHERALSRLMGEMSDRCGSDALDYLEPRVHLVKGWPRKAIPALAEEIDASLVVMGTVARTGIAGLFMGNTAEAVINRLDCSILAIKPPGFKTPVTLET